MATVMPKKVCKNVFILHFQFGRFLDLLNLLSDDGLLEEKERFLIEYSKTETRTTYFKRHYNDNMSNTEVHLKFNCFML